MDTPSVFSLYTVQNCGEVVSVFAILQSKKNGYCNKIKLSVFLTLNLMSPYHVLVYLN